VRAKIYSLASNVKLHERTIFLVLEDLSNSINDLYDKIPTEKQIVSAKTKSKDTGDTGKAAAAREQLKELEAREKRANQIYG